MASEDDSRLRILSQRILDLEAENIELRGQLERLEQARADVSLVGFVQSVGLAAAVGESTMPGRAVSSIEVMAQSYLVPQDGEIGLRLVPPELATAPVGLSSTSFELAKVLSADAAAPRNLYAVLEEKQHLYGGAAFEDVGPAVGIVVEIAKALANSGGWTFRGLVDAAADIAELERQLADALVERRPPAAVSAYRDAILALEELAKTLAAKPRPVAGDVFALASALDATTRAAAAFA